MTPKQRTTSQPRQIRALFDNKSVTVYQAYSPIIAVPAIAAQTFVAPFKPDRMTWIKPSFLWMMHRSGWATKENQERILAVQITRAGFEAALSQACLSHFDPTIYSTRDEWRHLKLTSPVRIQWDPERDFDLNPLPRRSLQVGLSKAAVQAYVEEWIVSINDVTERAQLLRSTRDLSLLPNERPYPLPEDIARVIGANQ